MSLKCVLTILVMVGSIFEMGVAPPGAGRGHHRGPPRGPIKGDQSHFFGREGDYHHRRPMHIPFPTVLIAIVMGILLVFLKVYLKPTAPTKQRNS